ncbi:MAG: tRNA (adenosine(37)-N6)-threonylcarbamoyltransferase complex transferase subunit TsaD [Flavobacteriales bacterium]
MAEPLILAIESSCDDTSAAVLRGRRVLSNVVAGQNVHEQYGGVVPELASRAHQSNMVPVVQQALRNAQTGANQLQAIAFTQGPGLMGSLHVGVSFAKSMAMALGLPLLAVNHMQAHILAHFIAADDGEAEPQFPLLCLTVSGGHTQLVLLQNHHDMRIVGETIDDAAGEAFDKAAKVLGLPYPGGPHLDRLAANGDAFKFNFNTPRLSGFDYSFSGLKTSLLYFLRDAMKENPEFIHQERNNICASYQRTVVQYLLARMEAAAKEYRVTNVCLAGGVSANSELRKQFETLADKNGWQAHIPPFEYCTDNAAMIGITAYYQYLRGEFAPITTAPLPSITWGKGDVILKRS